MNRSDNIEVIIDRVLDDDRDPLGDREKRCIILENRGSKKDRLMFLINRAAGLHV